MSVIMKLVRSVQYPKYCKHVLFSYSSPLLKTKRYFNRSPSLCLKMFLEHENKYAYNIMKNKGYAVSFDTEIENKSISKEQFENLIKEDWSKKPANELFDYLPVLGEYSSKNNLCISNKCFDDYIDNLTDHLKQANDEELLSIFYSLKKWPETPSIRTRNYIEIWVALDDICLSRVREWPADQMLKFISLFFMLNVTKVSDFFNKCIQKLATKAKSLSPGQLVQTMFFIGVLRKSPFDMHNLEVQIGNLFSEFTIDELAIISMGFFKSKTPIRDINITIKLVQLVIDNAKNINEVSLAALLKVIRYSIKMYEGPLLYEMLDVLQHEVPRLSLMCNVHIALTGSSTLTLHEGCLQKIAECTIDKLDKTRLKDLERLVLTFGTFIYTPKLKECYFTKVMDELRKPIREEEIKAHGRSFASCISYFGLVGLYPVDLMSKVLSKEFLNHTYGKQYYLYGREVLVLHNSAEVYCKNAQMNRLADKEALVLAKKYTDFVPSVTHKKQYNVTEKMTLDVRKVLQDERGGEDFVAGDHILTHHQRGDIIICNNQNGEPVKVTDIFNQKKFGLLRHRPDDNIWIVLVIAGRNSILKCSNTLTGPFEAKLRELRTLGYHTSVILWSKYSELRTTAHKLEYINGLIQEAIKN